MEFHDAPKGLAEWLICGACALWIAGLAVDFTRKIKGEPGKPANEELGNNMQDVKDHIQELKREDAILHTRCTDLRSSVSRIEGKLEKL